MIRAPTRPLTELGREDAPLLWQTRDDAEQAAATWQMLRLESHAEDWSFTTVVTDPPPAEIIRYGRRYYLAQFNAHRIIYSPHPPPTELAPGT